MEERLPILIAAGVGDDQRLEALVRGCELDPPRIELVAVDRAREAIERGDGVAVLAVSRDPNGCASLLDAFGDGGALGAVLVTRELGEEVTALANRLGARIWAEAHGPASLRQAILRAADDGARRCECQRLRRELVAAQSAANTLDTMRILIGVAVSDVIFHLGVEGDQFRFLEINPAFTTATGLPSEMVVGRFVHDVIPGPSLGLVLAKYRLAIDERRTVRWTEETKYPTGTKHGEVSVTPVLDAGGQCVRLLGTVRDVTQERELRARIVLAERMAAVGTLAAGVAHEINNPLAYVVGNLELIAEELATPSGNDPSSRLMALGELIDEARHGAERVRTVVQSMKTFARAEGDRRVPLDVRAIAKQSLDATLHELRPRARIVCDLGDVPLVNANEAQLGQVFIQLLINAAHAIPEGRVDDNEIRLTTHATPQGRVAIEFRDSGGGIPSEIRNRIFDPFFTTKGVGGGTGLGLSICQTIVSALDGEIQVESEAGKGSTFRVILPAASPSPQAVSTDSEEAPPQADRRGQVLVVDDDPMVGRLIRRTLAKAHDVTVVTSGRQALDLLLGGKDFDVILCDLMMPNMTGMDLHGELSRAVPEVVDRMVFVTGGACTPTSIGFLDSVPNKRVDKPFDPASLRLLVRNFVR